MATPQRLISQESPVMPESLWPYLRPKMLPLALTFGLIGALAPPALVGGLAWQRVEAQLRLYADQSATIAAQEAGRTPYLWQYRLPKLLGKPAAEIDAVEVLDCHGKRLHYWRRADTPEPTLTISHTARVLTRDQQLATLTAKANAQNILWELLPVGLISSLISLILAMLVYHVPRRAVDEQGQRLRQTGEALLGAKEELERANLTLQSRIQEAVEELRVLSAAHLNTQDDERARIARELHDGLGQNISALRLELERAEPAHIDEAKRLCAQTLVELRHIIEDLRPVALEQGTLSEVLRDMAERFELSTGIATFFKHRGGADCPDELAASVLRVFQEALHNIKKHAQASEVGVTLEIDQAQVTLTISDDGVGFDPAQGHPDGHGLRNIRARARLLEGSCELITATDEGCTLTFSLPMPRS